MTLEQKMAQFGLKDNEIKVYLAVLELGEPTVGTIQEQTGLHKQLIYIAATSLQDKGLLAISEVRGRKRFSVPDPGALETHAQEQLKQAQTLVPHLFQRANKKRAADKVRTYRGLKGVQEYYLDTMRKQPENSEVFILGVNSQRYFEIFHKSGLPYQRLENIRTERKITWNLLLFGAKEHEIELNEKRPLVNLKLLEGAVKAPMDIMIWHDHVGMLFYTDEPYVLDMMGQETVIGFKEYFQLLWKQGNKVYGQRS